MYSTSYNLFYFVDLHPGNIVLKNMKGPERDFGLCFLDAGLVVTLTHKDKRNFEDLFLAVVRSYAKPNFPPIVCIAFLYVRSMQY